jgi:hypothetical protein
LPCTGKAEMMRGEPVIGPSSINARDGYFGNNFVEHNGSRIKIDRALVRTLLEKLGQVGANTIP